jgi:two-component system chemotaxis response regulator CheY
MFGKDTHILVVDDSINIRQIIRDCLTRIGYSKIETAKDASEGYEKLAAISRTATPINLILSDLNMPGPNGIDFLKKVREDKKFQDLPFILITTESEKQSVIMAAMAGVSSYIVKPFNVDTLVKRLEEAWKKHNP